MTKQKINLACLLLFILVIISISLNLDTEQAREHRAEGVEVGAFSVSSSA